MYGKGWPGPTASGVSTGKICRLNTVSSSSSSAAFRSSISAMVIPCSSRAGLSWRFQSFACSPVSRSARSRISRSASCGVIPSGERTAIPAAAWSVSPATRTMKNSSRFEEKIEQKFTRVRSGRAASEATSRTRALKSSHESSRLRKRACPSTVSAATKWPILSPAAPAWVTNLGRSG